MSIAFPHAFPGLEFGTRKSEVITRTLFSVSGPQYFQIRAEGIKAITYANGLYKNTKIDNGGLTCFGAPSFQNREMNGNGPGRCLSPSLAMFRLYIQVDLEKRSPNQLQEIKTE